MFVSTMHMACIHPWFDLRFKLVQFLKQPQFSEAFPISTQRNM